MNKNKERVSDPNHCFERIMFFEPANKTAWLKRYELEESVNRTYKCADCEYSGDLKMNRFFSAVRYGRRKTKGVWCGPCPKCHSENTPFVYVIPNDEL